MNNVVPLKLSAMIVARNEAGQLAECLARLTFADEIVVVLDRSTDASKIIALSFGAKLVEGAWPVEGPRREAGQAACNGDWILEVDADERVTPELAAEIKVMMAARSQNNSGADFYRIPFDNYIGQQLVRYGWGAQFGVSAAVRFYRKGVKHWGDQKVHPKVKMDGANGGPLNNRMVHYVDDNVSDMLQRLDRYTNLNAADLNASGNVGTLRKNILRIFGRFYKCFVLRKGYKEGGLGLLIAICAALYPILSYLKALELQGKASV